MSEQSEDAGFPEPTVPDEILKHIVGIVVYLECETASGRIADAEVATGIIVSIQGQWFLISAGHLVDDLRDRCRTGAKILGCNLITVVGSSAGSKIAIGLFDSSSKTLINQEAFPVISANEDGLDCLILPVNETLRELLEVQGIEALDESTWQNPPANPDVSYVAGFSSSLAKLGQQHAATHAEIQLKIPVPIVPISPTASPPAHLRKKLDRLFFKIPKVRGMSNEMPLLFDHPAGLSGGPIIAARATSETQLEATLVGIQSGWDEKTRTIAATPWPYIVAIIHRLLERLTSDYELPGH